MRHRKIVVVAAHPDDEVLGCGGTLARLSAEGNDLYSLILGEGVTSRDEKRNREKRREEIDELKGQIEEADKILGIKKCFSFDLPDNRFDTVALLDIVKTIEKIKKEVDPDVVFTHHHSDLNIDHRITFKAVLTAFRPNRGERTNEIYSFEVPSSTEWNVPLSSTCFTPNHFIDISKTLEMKIKAMKEYKSEIRDFPHPRSPEAIAITAQKWGIHVGLDAAEAFELVRSVK